MKANIEPATVLPNGTWFVKKGTPEVNFNCSSTSLPEQNLTWIFEDATSKENRSRAFGNGAFLLFQMFNIQSEDQGSYTCLSQNIISKKAESRRMELLVYCMAYKLLCSLDQC